MGKKDTVEDIVYEVDILREIPEEGTEFLVAIGVKKKYQKRDMIFERGDQASHLFLVIDGWVKLSNINADGQESSVRMHTRGDVFDVTSVLNGRINISSAYALTECVLLEVSAEVLKEKIKENPDFAKTLLNSISHELTTMQISSACSSFKEASQRVACLLLRLSSWMVGAGGVFKLPYDKGMAATQLGMDQATFSRAMARLEDMDVFSRNGEFHIENFQTLSEHCCVHCPISEQQCAGRSRLILKESKNKTKFA